MALDTILGMLQLLGPVLSNMSAAAGKNQDTNTLLSNNSAAQRPGMVGQNLHNSRLASMFSGYTPPKLNWGGPGSVAKGQQPSITGGTSPDSPEVSALQKQVQQDALHQADTNYGIQDPAASSAGSKLLGGASSVASILGALKGLFPSSPASGVATSGPTTGSTVANGGLPVGGGGGGRSYGSSPIPGYFRNPDGSLVPIPGDPANGGLYGGGLFQDTDPRHD